MAELALRIPEVRAPGRSLGQLKMGRNRDVSELNRICAACIKEPYLGSIIASADTTAEPTDVAAGIHKDLRLERRVLRWHWFIEVWRYSK